MSKLERMVDIALARGYDKVEVVDDFPDFCGLTLNDDLVAELSHEDSGIAPLLWRIALEVLRQRRPGYEEGVE